MSGFVEEMGLISAKYCHDVLLRKFVRPILNTRKVNHNHHLQHHEGQGHDMF